MARADSSVDVKARLLLHATEGDLRKHLGSPRLDVDLVGDLYVRIRDVLARAEPAGPERHHHAEQLVDDLALAVYLAVVAKDSRHAAGPGLLVELRRSLEKAITEDCASRSSDANRR